MTPTYSTLNSSFLFGAHDPKRWPRIVKILPKTQTEWQKAALFTISAPMVIVTVANLAAFVVYENSRVLTRVWFLSDAYLQSLQAGPCAILQGVSAIGTIILSFAYLFVDRNQAALGFLVFVVSFFVSFMTPVIIHE